jgi:hypothetical protein
MCKPTATTVYVNPTQEQMCEVESLIMDSAVRGVLYSSPIERRIVINALHEDSRMIILQELEEQALSSSATIIIV